MRIPVGCKTQDSRILCPVSCILRLLSSCFLAALLGAMGCGEESPTANPGAELIKTGISGTSYLNVEHGFRLSNLPSSGWVVKTRKYRHAEANTEDVLLMAFTTEDRFTFDTDKLMDEHVPFAEVSVYGPDPDLPSKPDVAKEIMSITIAVYEWWGIEVISRKPIAAVNTTGYEATLSMLLEDVTWAMKQAYFAKHDMGYMITFWAPEDKYIGLLAYIDPIIASFELLGL
jgi:hypothetical protein